MDYCKFHKARGHHTKDCYQLKNAIEDAVRRGYLKDFVDLDRCNPERPAQRRRRDDDQDDERPAAMPPGQTPPVTARMCYGEISTIAGGPPPSRPRGSSGAGSSRGGHVMNIEAKRPRMVEAISFDKDDLEGIQVPHNDALILLARIANRRVRRVMVDTSASVDILFNHCYEQIKHTIQT